MNTHSSFENQISTLKKIIASQKNFPVIDDCYYLRFIRIVSWMIPMTSTHSNLVLLQLRVLLHLRWVRRPQLRRPLPLQPPPQQLLLLRVQLQVQLFTVAAMAMSM